MGWTRLLLKQLKLEILKKTLSVVYLLQIKAKIVLITKIHEQIKELEDKISFRNHFIRMILIGAEHQIYRIF